MFNEYYYTNEYQEPVYFSIININNAVETSLYIGNKLVKRNSFQRGIHLLQKDNVVLKVQIKWFKVIPELRINNKLIEIQKFKRNQIRTKLMELNITNELNPRVLPKELFNYRKLKMPIILIFIGSFWEVLTDEKGKWWDIPSMVIFVIAYIQLFSPLVEKAPERHMDNETKGKFKFIIGITAMIFTQILISKILNSF